MAQTIAVPTGKRWSFGDFFHGPWSLLAVPISLICLVALTERLVQWAPLIDWVAEKYSAGMAMVLVRSPIHIASEWNDYIILSCVVFVITNVGYHRRTGKLFLRELLSFGLSRSLEQGDAHLRESWQAEIDELAAFLTGCAMAVVVGVIPTFCFLMFMSFFLPALTPTIETYAQWPFIIAVIVSSGFLVAWRWVMITGLLFASLVIGNEIYVHWLATTQLLAGLFRSLLSL
jgi:hypothetical protein